MAGEVYQQPPYPSEAPVQGFMATLFSPQFLKPIAIFSVVVNIVLLIALIAASSGDGLRIGGPPPITPLVLPQGTSTPTQIARPSVEPTKSTDQVTQELLDCYSNCTEIDAVNTLKKNLLTVKEVKANQFTIDERNQECSGMLIFSGAPANEYKTHITPLNCPSTYDVKLSATEYIVGTKSYINIASRWEQGSVKPLLQPTIFEIADELSKQQVLSTGQTTTNTKEIIGKSKIVNEFNQSVELTITVVISPDFKLLSYSKVEDEAYAEFGTVYDYSVANDIKAPL